MRLRLKPHRVCAGTEAHIAHHRTPGVEHGSGEGRCPTCEGISEWHGMAPMMGSAMQKHHTAVWLRQKPAQMTRL